jgi:phenylalanyl-tRNA synthetase alpha chain
MDLQSLREAFNKDQDSIKTLSDLDQIRIKYLGKKGLLTENLKQISSQPPGERKSFGKAVNELKVQITEELASLSVLLKKDAIKRKLSSEALDITLPGKHTPAGREHPVHQSLNRITAIFTSMGFNVEEGPEVETDYYNFEALNIPKDHPARDMQDTFYITDDVVLRTHTSPVQIRVMERQKPPLRFIAPGRVYRCDADVSHTPMFHQVEGLMVGEDITFGHLKGVLETFIHRFFGPDIPVRFRPSYFPFTEPSAEVDMGCIFCGGKKGCRVCKNSGWIEILGAGMVNPRVFEMIGYDPDLYTGFAFGMGVERIAMLSYSIDDIRILFENDIRFLRQF